MGVLIAIAAVMALIIGGGAFAITRAMGGGGDRPASAMPAGTVAYLQFDIDPAAGQKIAALKFFSDMDSDEMQALRDGDIKREVFELLTEEDESLLGELDYEEDVEPWLGDRVGLGMLDNGEATEPTPLVGLQVTNEGAAEKALAQIEQDEAAWYFHGDYVVITTAEQVEAAKSDTEAGNLAGQEYFVEDLEALGEQGLMSGWMDLAATSQLSQRVMQSDLGGMPSQMDGLYLGSEFGSLSEGRAAMTLRFGDDGIELAANSYGTPLQGLDTSTDTPRLVSDLPDDTVGVVSLEHGDQIVDLLWDQLSAIAPEEVAQAKQEAAAEGFELPGDLKVLVGDSLTLSAGAGIADAVEAGSDQVPVGYRAHTDTERAEALIEMLLSSSGMESETDLAYRSDDGVLSIAATQEYVDQLADGDGLGSSDLFAQAVPEADEAQSVLYIDVNAFEESYLSQLEGDERDALEKLAAVGVSTSIDEDGNGSFLLKVITD
jgi:hypothetical protein